jgi:hypothetical protein
VFADSQGLGNPLKNSSLVSGTKESPDFLAGQIKERFAMEELVQTFLLEISSVILVVIPALSFNEQNLLEKLKIKLRKSGKRLIVVHNLCFCETADEIEEEISRLKACLDVEEMKYSFQTTQNPNFFVSKSKDVDSRHLILAKHGTPLADYYNSTTLQYLTLLLSISKQTQLDLLNLLTNYLRNSLKRYVENNINFADKLQIQNNSENSPDFLYLAAENQVKLRTISADTNSHLNIFTNDFQPEYHVAIENGENELVARIEIQNFSNFEKLKGKVEEDGNKFRLYVKGVARCKHEREDHSVYHGCSEGNFLIVTPYFEKPEDFSWNRVSEEFLVQDGFIIQKWKFVKVNNVLFEQEY